MIKNCLLRTVTTLSKVRRFSSLPPEVIIFPDKDMVVCWHPEQNFPYEFSKPLPEEHVPYRVLNIEEAEVNSIFARKVHERQIADECAKLTFTTKHRWFPRSRDKKAKKTKPDRPYL